jgi:zinc protease
MCKNQWFIARIFLIGVIFMSSMTIQAQSTKTKTYNEVKIPNLPANFHLTELSNGLQVLVIEDHTVPLATIELVVRNGAFVQTPDLEGLAHLYEHMFFKANKDYPSQEAYLERINELGISFNGTTSEERVNYFITLLNSKLQEGLEFLNASARYPKFLESEMKKENVVVAGEFQRNESNPVFYLVQDLNSRLWGKEFSRKNTIGRYDVILNATPKIMEDIKNRYYYPNNSMLVVAGDVTAASVFPKVDAIYGDWKPSGFDIFKKYPIPEFPKLTYNQQYITENDNARIPIYVKAWQGPDTRNDIKGTYAADVFSFILSQQNSQLQKALVESGLAYQVSVNYQTQRYTGPIEIFMVPNPMKTKEAIEELNKQIALWTSPDYFTDEQLETAKEMLSIDNQYSKEQVSSYVHTVTFWWASANLEYAANYIDNIKKINRQDINSYLKKYVIGQPNVTGILVSKAMNQMIHVEEFFKPTSDISKLNIVAEGKKKVTFDAGAARIVDEVAAFAAANPDKKITVHVQAPSQKIAQYRADAIKKLLGDKGLKTDSIIIDWKEENGTEANPGLITFSI